MSKLDLQRQIRNNEGLILSAGTLRYDDLLAKSYDLVKAYNLRVVDKQLIPDLLLCFNPPVSDEYSLSTQVYYNETHIPDNMQNLAAEVWDALCSYFNYIAPSGYYFGSQEGDGALIGWFKAAE
jgi:hypothetical protein